jgi:C1A family cysteine protease
VALTIKRYGYLRDLPDQRDYVYAAPVEILTALPTSIDLRDQCPAVYTQGDLNSCAANAIAAAMQFERMKQNFIPDFIPSRLFLYYNQRVVQNTVNSDNGASIRDGIKSIVNQGDCPETEWPYDVTQFNIEPPPQCYENALIYRVIQYHSMQLNINQMKGCLASGYPFVFGFGVYESFEGDEVDRTGVVPMPGSSEQLRFSHCAVAVGYDDSQQRFIVRNSWGTSWGVQGYCTMPYAYLSNSALSFDVWTIRLLAA